MITLRSGTWLGQVPLVDRPRLSGAREMSDADFGEILSAPKAIVDFGSPGCPHCVAFKPIFESVAGQNPDILFASINTDNYQQYAAKYGISGLPTVVFLANGKEVDRMVGGAGSAGEFQAEIQKAYSGGGTPGGSSTFSSILGGAALVGILGGVSYVGYRLLKK